MNPNINLSLLKIITDILIFLEFSQEILEEDNALVLMEQISYQLQNLKEIEKQTLVTSFMLISKEYSGEKHDFVKNIPYTLGII